MDKLKEADKALHNLITSIYGYDVSGYPLEWIVLSGFKEINKDDYIWKVLKTNGLEKTI